MTAAVNIPRLPFVTCRFTLTGLNLERFMNTLQKEGVPLLRRPADGGRRTLECACYLRDLPRVRQLAGEKGWRVTRERPAQLAAVLGALRRRPGALVGAALALAAALVAIAVRVAGGDQRRGAVPRGHRRLP